MKKPLYLDYAATTPLDPAVLKAMLPYMSERFGNPGSLHSFGQQASAAVFEARQTIAKALGCHYSEIIFTGSATEANNLALRGAIEFWKSRNPGKTPRVVLPETEHDCVYNTAKGAREHGAEVVYVPVSKEGFIDMGELKKALNERTVIVSVMYANNEIGTIQPIAQIAKIINDFRVAMSNDDSSTLRYPLLHTDAVQAFEYMPCSVDQLGVDLMTISGHKIYGPKGIGCLYVRRPATPRLKMRTHPLKPVVYGGGQEEGLRSGTENVPAIVGFAKAASLSAKGREKEALRVAELRDILLLGVKKIFPKVLVNGPAITPRRSLMTTEWSRLPNHLSFYIPGVSAEELLVGLDLQGVIASSGSACAARSLDPSRVLLALGHDTVRAKNSIRVTLGRMTTKSDISRFLATLKTVKETLD